MKPTGGGPSRAARWLNQRRLRALGGLAVLVAAVAAADGVHGWRQQRWNERIAAGDWPAASAGPLDDEDARDRPPPQARFAQAAAWAASGADDAALNRWQALQDDPAVGSAARYNGANLLLRQAVRLRDAGQPGQAIPLIELAKESYRELLRRDPQHWNARYNLERAQRLLPDAVDDDSAPQGPARQAERAATTMRGYSPGLP